MYATISQTKIQNLAGSLIHNKRKHKNLDNVDYSKTQKNITLLDFKYKNQNDFLETKKREIKEHNKLNNTKHRMIQKDKSFSQEFIFSHSHDAMPEFDSIQYCKMAHNFIKDRFPNNEILNSIIHLDETTPHIHINISYFDKTNCKFNQKQLMKEKLTDINEIRKDFQEYIKADFPTLKKQDGSVVENHNKKASLEIAELKKENEHLKSVVDLKEIEIAELKEENKDLKDELETLQNKLTLAEKKNKASFNLNQSLKDEVKELQAQINDLECNLSTLEEKTLSRANIEHGIDDLQATSSKVNELDEDLFQNDDDISSTNESTTKRVRQRQR